MTSIAPQSSLSSDNIILIFILFLLFGLYCYQIYKNSILQKQLEALKNHSDQEKISHARFLRHINHTIRTPVNGISGFIYILQKEIYGSLSKPYHDYIHMTHESLNELMLALDKLEHFSNISDNNISAQMLRDQTSFQENDPYISFNPLKNKVHVSS